MKLALNVKIIKLLDANSHVSSLPKKKALDGNSRKDGARAKKINRKVIVGWFSTALTKETNFATFVHGTINQPRQQKHKCKFPMLALTCKSGRQTVKTVDLETHSLMLSYSYLYRCSESDFRTKN